MTNIWAKSFEEVRKPFFEMDDPYTLREKKEKESKSNDGNLANNYPPYDKVTRGDVIAGALGKDEMGGKKKVKKEEIEQVDEAEKWIQGAIKKPGALHRQLDVPEGEKIPAKKLAAAAKKGGKLGQRARLAQTLSGLRKEEYIGEVNDSKETKLDVKKGIKNKVVISPQIKEELETWIGELVEEGYDLSKFTWQEMLEIYESAEFIDEGTAGMPAAGDAQTVTVDPLAAAKAKAAKAKVAKERADLQVAQQSQRMKVSANESFDSIVEYLSQRPNAFENLEEGVFNPKKSKMRPASERSQRSMTDAQRKAAKKEAERTAKIHSKGETVLAGMRSSGTKGKVKTAPAPKPEAPKANRKVKGRYDKLAKAASDVLKDIKK